MTAGNGGATFVITKYNTAANAGNNNTAPTDWTFGTDGNLTLPTVGSLVGNLIVPGSIVSSGASPAPYISGFSSISALTLSAPTLTNGNSNVTVNSNSNLWTFDSTGNLTLPANAFAINYANGTRVSLGGSYGNSNVATFLASYGSNTISTTGNVSVGNIGTTTAIITTGNITTINSGLFQNGNSNVTITSNANVSVFTAGNATAQFVVTSSGANISGTANIVGNANVGNIGATQGIFTTSANIPIVQNGTSNLTITSGANISMFVAGNTTARAIFTSTGANIAGNLDVASGNITGNTNGFAIGYLNIPQVAAANATLALTDAGKHYYSTTAGNLTLTIPTNANVAFATGTAISVVVQAAGNVLVNAASGVTLYMGGNSTAGNRVISTYGMATLMKVATNTWFINGTGVA